jgi:transposase
MDDRTLYAKLLGLTAPWNVEKVELKLTEGEVHITVGLPPEELWVCPECLERAPIYDHKERTWRHLDTFQYRTFLHGRVPRLQCPTHGTKQLRVPWAEEKARFTALFECIAIDWMRVAPLASVASRLGLSWDEAAGIQERAVRRGLARRKSEPVKNLGIDETSFQRRHEYVTIVNDLDRPRVLYVADDRKQESLDPFWSTLSPEQLAAIEGIALDMWDPYLRSIHQHVPNPAKKIVFDKYHVAAHLNRSVDQVRRTENRELISLGSNVLKGTKYDWLRHPDRFTPADWRQFTQFLRAFDLKTARAWAIKESFMRIYELRYPAVVERQFQSWFGWARRSRLEPIKNVALTIKRHWENIRTYFDHRITNAGSESMNSKIQRVKAMARGYRNRARFRMAIYFHCGELDLYPRPLHT